MLSEDQLRALLRLKRHELPPPAYFDQLLADVHRRQRTELLRRPLWQLALERWQMFFSELSMGSLSYATGLASVVLLGGGALALFTSGAGPVAPVAQVAQPQPVRPAAPAVRVFRTLGESGSAVHLAAALPPLDFQTLEPHSRRSEAPRYVIDAQPASYDVSSF